MSPNISSPTHLQRTSLSATPKAEAGPSSAGPSNLTATVRLQRACSSCAKQKVKCDGERPCARCVTLSQPDGCDYLPSLRGKIKRSKTAKAAQEEGSSSLGRDVETLNSQREVDYARWKHDDRTAGVLPSLTRLVEERGTLEDRQHVVEHSPEVGGLSTLPMPGDAPNPLAALAQASADLRAELNYLGDGRETFYAPVARVLKDDAPHILTLISVQEAERLFDIYFRVLHPHFPVLDQAHCSPVEVARRNNFLFNAICCVAAHVGHPVLWERLKKDFARFETERIPKDKSVEVVQGHLIYSQWNLNRPKSFEEDMTWLRIGLAVRTAIDVNIHRAALDKQGVRDSPKWVTRNILRTWLCCYIVDRSLSSQLGKPASVRGENGIRLYMRLLASEDIRESLDDIWVGAMAEWTMILTRGTDVSSNEAADFVSALPGSFGRQTTALPDIIHAFSQQFRQWRETHSTLASSSHAQSRRLSSFTASLSLHDAYARMILHSFGFQRANDGAPLDLTAVVLEYQNAARRLIGHFIDEYETTGLIRGCPDFIFTIITYAAVALLRLKLADSSSSPIRQTADVKLARQVSDMLAQAALTVDHLPASQGLLISRLLEKWVQSGVASTVAPAAISMDEFTDLSSGMFSGVGTTPSAVTGDLSFPLTSDGLLLPAWCNSVAMNGIAQGSGLPELDPFAQQQELLFTHEDLWKTLFESSGTGQTPLQ